MRSLVCPDVLKVPPVARRARRCDTTRISFNVLNGMTQPTPESVISHGLQLIHFHRLVLDRRKGPAQVQCKEPDTSSYVLAIDHAQLTHELECVAPQEVKSTTLSKEEIREDIEEKWEMLQPTSIEVISHVLHMWYNRNHFSPPTHRTWPFLSSKKGYLVFRQRGNQVYLK